MGKDGGGGTGAYDSTERRTTVVAPDKIYLLTVTNGCDYEDFREWPWMYLTSEKEAKETVDRTTKEIEQLFNAARDYHQKIDYAKSFEDTAAGKRYTKYLKDKGIVDKKETYTSNHYQVYFQELRKGPL